MLTVDHQVDDLQSAISFAKSKGYQKVALYGHSLGSLICLKCYTPEIVTMVLSGALTDAMTYNWNHYFTKEQMDHLKENGFIIEKREDSKIRKTVFIDKQMLIDFEEINQKELLKPVACPVLIIHGDNKEDQEELLLLQRSKKGMHYLSSSSKLEVIADANHTFLEHLDLLTKLAKEWYSKHLGEPDPKRD